MVPVNAEAQEILRALGRGSGERLNLLDGGLALAVLHRPQTPLERYRHHMSILERDLVDEVNLAGGPEIELEGMVESLNTVLFERHGYRGDDRTYDDLQNANLARVIDRRKGLPVALGILYMHLARHVGLEIHGLTFPGHFLLRVERGGRRAILDPFNLGQPRRPPELREMLKSMQGEDAELTVELHRPVPDRVVLLRLQNNLKLRQIRARDLEGAMRTLESMLLFAPNEPDLLRELGLLHVQLGNVRGAIETLETYMDVGLGQDTLRFQIAALLQELRGKLN